MLGRGAWLSPVPAVNQKGLGLVGRQEGGSQGWGRGLDVQRDGNRMLEWLGKVR